MEILDQIKEFCIYDEDKAARNFFVGLCYEMSNDKDQMLLWYEEVGKYGHRFYLPYLKLAKTAYNEKRYAKAKEYYITAIDCLLEMPEDDREEMILGSSYANLTSCLIMLNEYETAETMWNKAQNYPLQITAPAIAAILYAAIGDLNKMNIYQ